MAFEALEAMVATLVDLHSHDRKRPPEAVINIDTHITNPRDESDEEDGELYDDGLEEDDYEDESASEDAGGDDFD